MEKMIHRVGGADFEVAVPRHRIPEVALLSHLTVGSGEGEDVAGGVG